MGTLVGVWIDHTKAVIVEAGKDAVALVASHVPAHTRFTGGGTDTPSDSNRVFCVRTVSDTPGSPWQTRCGIGVPLGTSVLPEVVGA
jgi:hypothetical protein